VRTGRGVGCESFENLKDVDGYGCVVYAVMGEGAHVARLERDPIRDFTSIRPPRVPPSLHHARFLDTWGSSSVHVASHQKLFQNLQIPQQRPNDIQSTQLKYVALALGVGDAWVKIPPKASHVSWVWDHSGGQLIYREVGGMVASLRGTPFAIRSARKFEGLWGMAACSECLHEPLLRAIEQVLSEMGCAYAEKV
jgi:3'(2'), 5'-bisphosphate nucleotidase